jgi:hypothetical protein
MPGEVISQPGGAGGESGSSGPTQSQDRSASNFEPSQDEQTVVKNWLLRVGRAESRQDTKTWREDLDRLRRYERGEQTIDDKKSRTNMVFSTIAAMMPDLYAKNPMIAVTPTDAVPQANMGTVKRFAATGEKVVRKMLVEEGRLKKRAKANIRSACATSYGVLKMVYQKEYRGDPLVVRRIEDSQDNLARVEALIRQLKKTDDPAKLAQQRDELHANLQALSSGNEVRIFKGFVVDRMKSEDFLVLDDNVDEFDEYVDARALGHKIWMTVAQARQLFNMEPHGATKYGRPRTDDTQKTDDTPGDEQFICVIEVWDKENGVVRTVAKGMNRWLREPYAPQNVSQRWYPFFVLGFNLLESRWRPLSDIELLASLQDEYDRTRQNFADVREKAVPVLVFRKGGNLTEDDVKNLTDRKNKDTIGVEGNPAAPISQDIAWFQGANIDPAAYDVSLIRNDMDLVSGRSDASRANLIKPKTATEAEIMQDAMQSRVGERRDTHEDLLSDLGEAALEIALQDLSIDEVKELAGEDAEWPKTPQGAEEVFRMVSVKVRAGSSGRPNQQREREQWATLMPVIKDTMQQVAELRLNGNYDMADATLELLRETLRRYDEHLDLDSIIPPMEKDEAGNPIAQQQAAVELAKVRQELTQCQEDLAKCQQDLQAAKTGEAAKVRAAELAADQEAREALRKANEQAAEEEKQRQDAQAEAARLNALKIAQEEAKAEAERTRQAELKAKDELERARMDKEFDLEKKKIEAREASAVEIARINAEAKAEGGEGGKGTDDVQKGLAQLLEQFQEFIEADRVPEYGPDGMPTRVRIVPKKRKTSETAH